MPFSLPPSRGRSLKFAGAALAAILPLALGLPLVYWLADQMLEQGAHLKTQASVKQIELILDDASLAADAVEHLAGHPCNEAELLLRHKVIAITFARSVNLVHAGMIRCTSVMGPTNDPEEAEKYVEGTLRMMPGNDVTPGRPLLVYRRSKGQDGVLVGIDGKHIYTLLQGSDHEPLQRLHVGEQWMDGSGIVSNRKPLDFKVVQVRASSSRYPFTVDAGYPPRARTQYILNHYLPLIALLLFSAIAGTGAYSLGQRNTSPTAELKRALRAREFVPWYQPMTHGKTNGWVGAEVLMRWHHPSEGLVPPDQFIPLAESSGLIVPMTRTMMEQVSRDLAAHVNLLPAGFHIGINVTAAHFQDLELVDDCRRFLDAFPDGSVKLILELTEREVIHSTAVTSQLFTELKKLNIGIAIDDFGTGHSSLAYLQEFHVDYLKIDRSFVRMIDAHALSRHLLDNIIDLASRLDLAIIAEGIETPDQWAYLHERGIDYLQGYLFARPMQLDALLKTIAGPVPTSRSGHTPGPVNESA